MPRVKSEQGNYPKCGAMATLLNCRLLARCVCVALRCDASAACACMPNAHALLLLWLRIRNHERSGGARVLPLQTDLFKYVSLAGGRAARQTHLDLHHIILIQVHVCPVCVQEGLTTLHQHTHESVCSVVSPKVLTVSIL